MVGSLLLTLGTESYGKCGEKRLPRLKDGEKRPGEVRKEGGGRRGWWLRQNRGAYHSEQMFFSSGHPVKTMSGILNPVSCFKETGSPDVGLYFRFYKIESVLYVGHAYMVFQTF
jgi:hypothetical protein